MSVAWQFYISTVLIYLGVDVIACWGLNLQFGVAGLVNFAFIIFQAAGAYTAAVLTLGPAQPASQGGFQQYVGGAHLPFPLPILAAMGQASHFLWITGNHDPHPPAWLGGAVLPEWREDGLVFRHEPAGEEEGEIVARSLADYLLRHPSIESRLSRTGRLTFYTTETPGSFERLAAIFFDRALKANHLDVGV